ncbi:MAG: hypothetical protein H0U67_14510 [Gemmatimonadetes bacterium]|nr:hypothetical protein [Gemmatimonadota bacterium]
MRRFVLALALVGAVCAFSAPAEAQTGSRIVTTQLDSAVVMMRGQAFTLTEPYRYGGLDSGGEERLGVELKAGNTYMIMGTCDQDCDDLDLFLISASGETVDSDVETDDVPMVTTTVARDATYFLRVKMHSCSIAPCGYGIGIFAKRN